MSEEELYKLLNIPNKPWIELTDEEIQLFEKNNNYIKKLQQENTILKQQLKDKDEKISKVKEYITSYESISTIQSLEFSKDNDSLDEKTMTEMCRRYLIVHDTILEILESE